MTPAELSSSGVPAFSQVYSWASVGRRALCSQSGRARLEVCGSLRQRLVRDSFTSRRTDKAVETIQRVPLNIAVVEAKRELVDVATKMLPAGVMVDAMHTTLEQRPYTLDAVGGHGSACVLTGTMIDRLMPEKQSAD